MGRRWAGKGFQRGGDEEAGRLVGEEETVEGETEEEVEEGW